VTIVICVGLTIGAFFLGRLVQWVKDAKTTMGSSRSRRS
jgi:hypothetical protein